MICMVFLQHRTFYTPSPLVTSSLSPLEDAVVANLESSQSAMSCGEGGGKQVRSRNTICLWVWLPRQRAVGPQGPRGWASGKYMGGRVLPSPQCSRPPEPTSRNQRPSGTG